MIQLFKYFLKNSIIDDQKLSQCPLLHLTLFLLLLKFATMITYPLLISQVWWSAFEYAYMQILNPEP